MFEMDDRKSYVLSLLIMCWLMFFACSFYRCEFDPLRGGEMTQLEYHNFLKPETALWIVILDEIKAKIIFHCSNLDL